MLSLSPRFDQYRFLLPKEFLPEEVQDKWTTILNKEPGVLISPIDYLNESIKGIAIPGIDDINITQQQISSNPVIRTGPDRNKLGRLNVEPKHDNTYIGSTNPLDKINKEITVTFRLNQGLYNYWMIYETIFYRICKHTMYEDGEDFYVDLLNEDGIVTARITFFQCHINGIDGLDFSMDKVDRQSDTFQVRFLFNNIDFEVQNIENLG